MTTLDSHPNSVENSPVTNHLQHTHILHPLTYDVIETFTAEWAAQQELKWWNKEAVERWGVELILHTCHYTDMYERCLFDSREYSFTDSIEGL